MAHAYNHVCFVTVVLCLDLSVQIPTYLIPACLTLVCINICLSNLIMFDFLIVNYHSDQLSFCLKLAYCMRHFFCLKLFSFLLWLSCLWLFVYNFLSIFLSINKLSICNFVYKSMYLSVTISVTLSFIFYPFLIPSATVKSV